MTNPNKKPQGSFLAHPRHTAVINPSPRFGQTPIHLLHDPSIRPLSKVVYGIFHSHCEVKSLESHPFTFISQKRIGREYLGCTQQAVSKAVKELEKAGWCTIIRQGQGYPNIIILHDYKGKQFNSQEKRDFIKLVRSKYVSRYHLK